MTEVGKESESFTQVYSLIGSHTIKGIVSFFNKFSPFFYIKNSEKLNLMKNTIFNRRV